MHLILNSLGSILARHHCRVHTCHIKWQITFASYRVPIYTPGWRAAMWIKCLAEGQSFRHWRGMEPATFDPESRVHSIYTTAPPCSFTTAVLGNNLCDTVLSLCKVSFLFLKIVTPNVIAKLCFKKYNLMMMMMMMIPSICITTYLVIFAVVLFSQISWVSPWENFHESVLEKIYTSICL